MGSFAYMSSDLIEIEIEIKNALAVLIFFVPLSEKRYGGK